MLRFTSEFDMDSGGTTTLSASDKTKSIKLYKTKQKYIKPIIYASLKPRIIDKSKTNTKQQNNLALYDQASRSISIA